MPKGLEILIPKKKDKGITPSRNEPIFLIEINKIKPNPFQPRKTFNKKDLKELADSIEKYGILQPLIAKKIIKETKSGQKVEYQLIAGERRLRAAKLIGLKEVPVIVQDIKKEDELPISLVENIQREDLNPIEKALAYKELIERHGFTQKEIGNIVGKSRESVANTLRLLDLPKEIQDSLKRGEISEGHARALLGFKEKERMGIFKKILEKNITVRDVEKLGKKKLLLERKDNNFAQIEKEIENKIGLDSFKIRITKEGKIELKIIFDSIKELRKFFSKK